MKLCSIEGCVRESKRASLCWAHHRRKIMNQPMDVALRPPHGYGLSFLESLVGTDRKDCIKWHASSGYGQVVFRGKGQPAHRVMCILAHGEQPSDRPFACHSCGKGSDGCVNPNHIRWATPKENNADMVLHGTVIRGEASCHAKLTEVQVIRIWRDAKLGIKSSEISEMRKATLGQVCSISRGASWAWLTGELSTTNETENGNERMD